MMEVAVGGTTNVNPSGIVHGLLASGADGYFLKELTVRTSGSSGFFPYSEGLA